MNEKIPEDAPRTKRRVKPFGSGSSGHVTVPQSVAEVGDEVLIINIENDEMAFEEVMDFFVGNGHLPEPENYNPVDLYDNFDEYKNSYYDKYGSPTGADIAFFAELEEALEESAEIEKSVD